jgi:diguanylate cyclase (GGDEF)-like protein
MTLANRLDPAIDWLTPAHLRKDVHTRKRVRMFLISHMFGPITGSPIPISLWLIDPAPWPQVPVLAASIFGFWLFLGLIKLFPHAYAVLAHLSILNLNFAILWGSYHYGGASSPFLMWYVLMPMLAFFYMGATVLSRIAVITQLLAGLSLFLAAYVLSGETFPDNVPLTNMVYAGMASAFSATVYAFFMASYYATAVDSRSELIREVARHERTLDELTHAQADMERANIALEKAKNLAEARNAELEATRATLEFNALHDALTGLPNRRSLDLVLAHHAKRCAADSGGIALLHVDLDRFKQINDTMGHVAGDEMLIHVARLIRAATRPDDFIARVGGDEFIIVRQVSDDDTRHLSELANALIERICQPVPYQGHLCRVGASVGIAVAMGDEVDPKSLLVNSDIALYRVKQRMKGTAEFFSEEIQREIVDAKQTADDILRGIEQKEFISYYQPQFCARTHEIVGVEALVRWKHPVRGVLAPAHFLGIAEDINVLDVIDRLILESATKHFDRWADLGFVIPKVAVNVSARRLNDRGLIESLKAVGIRPGTVAFELVESVFLDETDETLSSNIEQIKALGIEIEIDDFGTGHASIVSLLRLSPQRLKIDRQFVAPILVSPEKRHLVSSIIEMGKSLGIEVVAEGVETMEQALVLRELGCDVLQGYAFAKPMPLDELEDFLRDRQLRKAS